MLGRNKKTFLSAMIVISLLVGVMLLFGGADTARAYDEVQTASISDGWIYRMLKDGSYELMGHEDSAAETLTLPVSIDGVRVSAIAADAFAQQTALKVVTVPASIYTIDETAFPSKAGDALCVRAYNGTAALAFAKARGLNYENLSKFDFFDDVLDLTDMADSAWTMDGNTLTVPAPYSALMQEGQKVYLPTFGDYVTGRPVTVLSITDDDPVLVTVSDLTFEEAVESLFLENVEFIPNYAGFIPAEDIFVGASAYSLRSRSAKSGLPINIEWEINNKVSLIMSATLSVGTTRMDVRYENFELQTYEQDFTIALNDITATLSDNDDEDETNVELFKETRKKKLGKLPFFTNGLVSAYLEVYLLVDADGVFSVYCPSVGITHHGVWDHITGYDQNVTTDGSTLSIKEIEGSFSFGPAAEVSVSVGFTPKLSVKVVELEFFFGLKGEAIYKKDTNCLDVSICVDFDGNIKIGLVDAEIYKKNKDNKVTTENKVPVNLYYEYEFPIPWKHYLFRSHLENMTTWQTLCTALEDTCLISFITFSNDVIADRQVPYGDYIYSPGSPSREGYVFTGWYTDMAATKRFTFSVPASEPYLTLYAGWDKVKPTPTPHPDWTLRPGATPVPTPRPTVFVVPTPSATPYITYTPPIAPQYSPRISGVSGSALPLPAIYELTYRRYDEKLGGLIVSCYPGDSYPGDILKYRTLQCKVYLEDRDGDGVKEEYVDSWTEEHDIPQYFQLNIPSSMHEHSPYLCSSCVMGNCDNPVYPVVCIDKASSNRITAVSLPSSVVILNDNAFMNSENLRSVSMPNGLRSIGSRAFSGCYALTDISIPAGVKSIGSHAFSGTGLSNAVLSFDTDSDGAFIGADNLQTLTLKGEEWYDISDPHGIRNLTFLPGSLYAGSLGSAPELTSISIPKGVETVVMEDCLSLISLYLPEGIADLNLVSCNALTHLDVPANTESVYINRCMELRSITLGAGVKELFIYKCTKLESINLPEGLVNIRIVDSPLLRIEGDLPEGLETAYFPNCWNLAESLTLPASIKDFTLNCYSLRTLRMAEGGKNWGVCDVPNLTTLDLPMSLSDIHLDNDRKIINSKNLEYVTMSGNLDLTLLRFTSAKPAKLIFKEGSTSVLTNVYVSSTLTVTIPYGVESIDGGFYIGYDEEFNAEYMEKIIIPSSVKSGGDSIAAEEVFVCWDTICALAERNQIIGGRKVIITGTPAELPAGIASVIKYASCVKLPDSITSIADHAMEGFCGKVILPQSLVSVGAYAFGGRNGEWPDLDLCNFKNIKFIGKEAFRGVDIQELILPAGIEIGENAFAETTISKLIVSGEYEYLSRFFSHARITDMYIAEGSTYIGEGFFTDALSYGEYGEITERAGLNVKNLHISEGVKEIRAKAFDALSPDNVTLEIPDGVEAIGDYAFRFWWNCLEKVVLPKTCIELGEFAFDGCDKLTEIDLSYVKKIGRKAFEGCSQLKYIELSCAEYIGSSAFYFCTSLESISITGIDANCEIESQAFYDCCNLKTADLSGVGDIGLRAFGGCSSLEQVTFGENCVFGNEAFSNCSSLLLVELHNNVNSSIYSDQFSNCTALEKVVFSVSGDDYTDIDIGDSMFEGCTALKSVEFQIHKDNFVELYISENAFKGCSSLSDFIFDKHMDRIVVRSGAFDGCASLTQISFPNDYSTSLKTNAFKDCENLKKITLGGHGNIEIEERAFSGCSSLEKIIFQENYCVDENENTAYVILKKGVFDGCTNLKSLTLPKGFLLEDGALSGCTALEKLNAYSNDLVLNGLIFADEVPAALTVYTEQGLPMYDYIRTYYPAVPIETTITPEFTVEFDSCGGTTVESITVQAGTLIPRPHAPVRESHFFTGWYTSTSAEPYFLWNFSEDRMYDNDLVLYAGWEYVFLADGESQDEGVVLTKLHNAAQHTSIPDTNNGKTVIGLGAQLIDSTVKTLHLPASIYTIDEEAFIKAANLTAITVDEGNAYFYSVDGVLYKTDGTLVCYPSARKGETFIVPEGTKALGTNAIYQAQNLTNLSLPATLTTLSADAIYDCYNLTEISFASDPAYIGAGALNNLPSEADLFGPQQAPNLTAYAQAMSLKYNEYTVMLIDSDQVVIAFTARAGEFLPELPVLTRSFHQQIGWKEADADAVWNKETDRMPADDLYLYAEWQFLFTWEETGDSVRITGYNGNDTVIELPEVLDYGYVTDVSEDCFGGRKDITLVGDRGSVSESAAEKLGLTFQVKTYSLTFVAMDEIWYGPIQLAKGEAVVFPETEPVRPGYSFQRWYCYYLKNFDDGKYVMPAMDITFYDEWKLTDADNPASNLLYTYTEEGVIITGCVDKITEMVIPDTLNGKSVVAIAEGAFRNSILTSVTIPDSVTTIGKNAFRGSEKLTSVTIGSGVASIESYTFADCRLLSDVNLPEGLVSIQDNAFSNCLSLTSVTLPAGLKNITAYAFEGCQSLMGIYVNELENQSNPANVSAASAGAYMSADGILFTSDGSTLVCYPPARPGESYALPENTISIAPGAIRSTQLKTLTLNAKLAVIHDKAMQNNTGLSQLIVPETSKLESIGAYAFAGCNQLRSVEFTDSLAAVGKYAFMHCPIETAVLGSDTMLDEQALQITKGMVVYGGKDSSAQRWAQENGVRFLDPDTDVPMTGMTLPELITVSMGETMVLPLVLSPENTTETHITYAVSNPAIAVIDAGGTITPISEGSCMITATSAYGAFEASCELRVEGGVIRIREFYLGLNGHVIVEMLEPGYYYYAETVIVPPDTTEDTTVTWTSSDPTVLDCTDGYIVPLKTGVVTMTVSLPNGMSDSVEVIIIEDYYVLNIPLDTVTIKKGAFAGSGFNLVYCYYDGLQSIGSRAFADMKSLISIDIPPSVTFISEDAFDGCDNLKIIYCEPGSEAWRFAEAHGYATYDLY